MFKVRFVRSFLIIGFRFYKVFPRRSLHMKTNMFVQSIVRYPRPQHQRRKHLHRKIRGQVRRRLLFEGLEVRQMLAADMEVLKWPENLDVNRNGSVEPLDALMVINALNAYGFGYVQNSAPIAEDLGPITIYQGQSAQINPFLADGVLTDLDCDRLTLSAGPHLPETLVEVDPHGLFTITPDASFNGDMSVTYVVTDSHGATDEALINLVVIPNSPPIANDLTFQITAGVAYTIDIPKIDLDGQPVTIAITTPPEHGTLTENSDGTFTYLSGQGFTGSDSFRYRASDGIAVSFGTVTLTDPTPPNGAPFAPDLSFTVDTGTDFLIDVPQIDPDGDAVTVTVESQPVNGAVLDNQDGTFLYQSDVGFSGTDTFQYRASDGKDYELGTITMTVVGTPPPDNNSPVDPTPDRQYDTTMNNSVVFALGVTDPDGDFLRYSIEYAPQNGALNTSSDGQVTYTPFQTFTGTDVFLIKVEDLRDVDGDGNLDVLSSVTTRRFVNVTTGGEGEGWDTLVDPFFEELDQ